MSERSTWSNIVLGTFVIYFATPLIPFAPAFGGAIVGYLEEGTPREGFRVGLFAGSLAYATLAVTLFLAGNLLFAAVIATDSGLTELLTALEPAVLVAGFLGSILYIVGLAGVGGWFGQRLADM